MNSSLLLVQCSCAASRHLQEDLLQSGDRQAAAQHSQLSFAPLQLAEQSSKAARVISGQLEGQLCPASGAEGGCWHMLSHQVHNSVIGVAPACGLLLYLKGVRQKAGGAGGGGGGGGGGVSWCQQLQWLQMVASMTGEKVTRGS